MIGIYGSIYFDSWFDAGTYIRVCSVRGLILMSKTEKFRPKFETESIPVQKDWEQRTDWSSAASLPFLWHYIYTLQV